MAIVIAALTLIAGLLLSFILFGESKYACIEMIHAWSISSVNTWGDSRIKPLLIRSCIQRLEMIIKDAGESPCCSVYLDNKQTESSSYIQSSYKSSLYCADSAQIIIMYPSGEIDPENCIKFISIHINTFCFEQSGVKSCSPPPWFPLFFKCLPHYNASDHQILEKDNTSKLKMQQSFEMKVFMIKGGGVSGPTCPCVKNCWRVLTSPNI